MTNFAEAAERNSAASYYHRREHMNDAGNVATLNPHPSAPWRALSLMAGVGFCLQQQPEPDMAVLDVSAGVGNFGQYMRSKNYPVAYYATEQSPEQEVEIKYRVPDAKFAQWRCEDGGPSLREAIGAAKDLFPSHFSCVILSHGVEHFPSAYKITAECWDMVKPGGYLLLMSARMHEHPTHFRTYDLDALVAVAAELVGPLGPVIVWPQDYCFDLQIAIPKPVNPTPEVVEIETVGPS